MKLPTAAPPSPPEFPTPGLGWFHFQSISGDPDAANQGPGSLDHSLSLRSSNSPTCFTFL